MPLLTSFSLLKSFSFEFHEPLLSLLSISFPSPLYSSFTLSPFQSCWIPKLALGFLPSCFTYTLKVILSTPMVSTAIYTLKILKFKFPTQLLLLNFIPLSYIKLTTSPLQLDVPKGSSNLTSSKPDSASSHQMFPSSFISPNSLSTPCFLSIGHKGRNIMTERRELEGWLPLLSQPWGGTRQSWVICQQLPKAQKLGEWPTCSQPSSAVPQPLMHPFHYPLLFLSLDFLFLSTAW